MFLRRRRSAVRRSATAFLAVTLVGTSPLLAALDESGNQLWGQFTPNLEGVPESGDSFGEVLASGDFNGDGRDDLAIGTPGESVGGAGHAGAVNVIYGGAGGLRVAGDQIWTRDSADVGGTPQASAHFGAALAAGDFNNDSYDDLAIGSPGSGPAGSSTYGGVNVLYGSASGLRATTSQLWTQDSFDVIGVAEFNDAFGQALAACDFNDDGFDDLAIGAPGEGIEDGAGPLVGAVNVLYGSASRLTEDGNQIWTQDSPNVADSAENGDYFGSSLTAGDFDADGACDLAIGVWGEDSTANTTESNGAVNVLYGAASGLSAAGNRIWRQGSNGVDGAAEQGDVFGQALAAGDLNGDGYDDLAVGIPGETVNSGAHAGAVYVLYGSSGGLSSAGDQLWHQASADVIGVVEDGDIFGSSVTIGDFDGDGDDDLAIGVPLEVVDGVTGAGAVNVLYGTANGLRAAGNQIWSQASPGVDGALEADAFGLSLAAGDFNGDGRDDLAIGVPGEDDEGSSSSSAGAVNVLYGS
jgi:hypothetical protein